MKKSPALGNVVALAVKAPLLVEQQVRLCLGPIQCVLAAAPRAGASAMWALPGGRYASTEQVLALARRNGWKRPTQIEVTIRRRAEPTHGD